MAKPPPTPPAKLTAKPTATALPARGSTSRTRAADADDDDDDLESAVFQERHGLDGTDRDLQTTCIDALLCCLRSRCLRLTCVLFPCLLFLLLALLISGSAHKLALLILAGVPPLVYVVCGLLLVSLACCRQVSRDTENAQAAHKYLQARRNLQKIAVTAGTSSASGSHITVAGRLALFFQAAKDSDLATFQWCLDHGQHVDETDYLGRTALHWAALTGTDEIVTVLLRNGASLDVQDALELLTPLHYAAYYGHVKIVRLLVTAGADLLCQDRRKMNALQLAEMAALKLASVQPSHQMILKFLRISMKDDATPPLQHTTGLTVVNLVERQMLAMPQVTD